MYINNSVDIISLAAPKSTFEKNNKQVSGRLQPMQETAKSLNWRESHSYKS